MYAKLSHYWHKLSFSIHRNLATLVYHDEGMSATVDGIDCMEGDGLIMGSLKQMGLILVGANLPAVDATAARIMGLRPERVSYLALAADRLGPIAEDRITQRGELWHDLVSPFQILDEPHLRDLRALPVGELVS